MILIIATAVAFARQASSARESATEWTRHTVGVLDATAKLRVAALIAIRGAGGYLLVLDPAFLPSYHEGVAETRSGVERLGRLVSDDPPQVERLERIGARLDQHLNFMDEMIRLAQNGRRDEVVARIAAGEGRPAVDLIMRELDAFEHVERRLLQQRRAERDAQAEAAESFELLLGLAGAVLIITGLRATLALGRSVARESAARRELEHYAVTDELTGLPNRRETLAALGRLIAGERRHHRPLSLAILDIDHFKRVNDTYGHPAGDAVIRRVGQLAAQVMREQDMVGRLGGEEFIVILPDTEAHAAAIACDRLLRVVAETGLTLDTGPTIGVTLSAGVAQMAPGDDQGQLIARADAALYAAKNAGRDRVLLAA